MKYGWAHRAGPWLTLMFSSLKNIIIFGPTGVGQKLLNLASPPISLLLTSKHILA